MYTSIFYERPEEDSDSWIGYIHCWDDTTGYKKIRYSRYAYKLDEIGTFKTLYGQPCKKVYRWNKEDEEKGIIYEGDIIPEMRYLIDNYTEFETPSHAHVKMFLDIEVDSIDGLPNITTANNKITAISYFLSSTNKYTALILDESDEIKNQDYTSLHGEHIYINSFRTEEDLLVKFMDDFIENYPTIITGWNIDGFDIPYLYNRIGRVLGSELANSLSPIGNVHWNERRDRYFIAGVSCLDYMQLYKKFSTGERISFSLDSIGKLEVGMGKIKYDGTLDKLFKEDKEKFIEYNIHDVRIVIKLDEKMKFIDLALGVCHKGHVPYEDIYFPARYLDGAMLTYMKLKGLVAPNKPKYQHHSLEDGEETFSGAYVKEPIPGKYKWVVDLDYTSLYPSIIIGMNISPETKVAAVENWNNMDYKRGKEKEYTINLGDKILKFGHEKMKEFLSSTKFSISSNGILYNIESPGIIPSILDMWFNERVEYKNLMKKFGKEKNKEKYDYYYMRQYIQKVILNSVYGVLGLPSFRFYDLENALAVTSTGVDAIHYAEKIVNYFYAEELKEKKDYIIAMDTDSLFFSVEPIVRKRFPDLDWSDSLNISTSILTVTKDIQNFVNASVDYFAKEFLNLSKHRFFMKQELIASSAFWTAKKRYAMNIINKEGIPTDELQVKGLDVVRTSFPKVFRDFMTDILKLILADAEKEVIDEKITSIRSKMKTFTLSDLARPTGVKNISDYWKGKEKPFNVSLKGAAVHVKASIMYNDFIRHYNLEKNYAMITNGDKIKWIYLKNNPLKIEAMAFKDNGEDPPALLEYINKYVDLEEVFESELVKKLTDFYDALKWGSIPTNVNINASKFF